MSKLDLEFDNYFKSRIELWYSDCGGLYAYHAKHMIYDLVRLRLGLGDASIPLDKVDLAKRILDDILPSDRPKNIRRTQCNRNSRINNQESISTNDEEVVHKKVGVNQDWSLTLEISTGKLLCTKSIKSTKLKISRKGVHDLLVLSITGDKYLPDILERTLRSANADSAANEADDIYRGYLTKLVKYGKKRLSKLPDI